jgi:para-nitrobenzyl esterase
MGRRSRSALVRGSALRRPGAPARVGRAPSVALPSAVALAAALALAAAFALGGCAGGSGSSASPSAKATLEQPVVEGGAIHGAQSSGIWSYLGIPYAAPPVGDLRWKPPQPVVPWKGVRDCTAYGPSCPQQLSLELGPLRIGKTSEDCLYLNVWTPAASPGERLPVMVWIHGGSFTSGSGSMPIYSGETLARAGKVVVVTINYRLGALGFLAHPALSAESPQGVSGNYGLLDQIAALRWVQKNIAAFGGDPRRVTAFGESAGAISILDLTASPLAAGLFQRAIVESGILQEAGMGTQTGWSLQQAERAGEKFVRGLGVTGPDALEAMRKLSADQLLAAAAAQPTDFLTEGLPCKPVIDGYVLPESATDVFAAGKQMDVPLLIGSNSDEGELFVPMMGEVTVAQYHAYLKASFGTWAPQVLALYPATSTQQVLPALSRLLTEMGFAATARFAAASMDAAGKASAYLYQFSRVPGISLPGFPKGAFHGLEIPYVFGKMGVFGVKDPVDLGLSDQIMAMWATFAATGDPNAAGSDRWPVYRRSSDEHLELGDAIGVKSGLYKQACDLADQIRLTD